MRRSSGERGAAEFSGEGDGDGDVAVSVEVRNVGERAGREVVQLYVAAPDGALGKPARALVGYAKTASWRRASLSGYR